MAVSFDAQYRLSFLIDIPLKYTESSAEKTPRNKFDVIYYLNHTTNLPGGCVTRQFDNFALFHNKT